jgi:site-specific DNA-cytosine methylase
LAGGGKVTLVALDLCCGLGGWANGFIQEGWRVIGVDIVDFSKRYPGEFVLANVLTWSSYRDIIPRPCVVLASTPCDEFARWGMPWTRKRNPPPPSLALWNRAEEIARELGAKLIRENVRAAQ